LSYANYSNFKENYDMSKWKHSFYNINLKEEGIKTQKRTSIITYLWVNSQ
jgi:hypothetical protein